MGNRIRVLEIYIQNDNQVIIQIFLLWSKGILYSSDPIVIFSRCGMGTYSVLISERFRLLTLKYYAFVLNSQWMCINKFLIDSQKGYHEKCLYGA